MGWVINGVQGHGECPELAGKFSGPLIIMGDAVCVWDDLSKVNGDMDIMSLNWAGCFARKKVHHWATRHDEFLPLFIDIYQRTYYPTNTSNPNFNFLSHIFQPHIYAHGPHEAENVWRFASDTGGSSAMFGVLVGLALGYEPIYLAGIPLDSSGSFYAPKPISFESYREFWIEKADMFRGRVKSFSGFTAELLGKP
jgi:hypothetical protein